LLASQERRRVAVRVAIITRQRGADASEVAELRKLRGVVDVTTAGTALSVSRSAAYDAIARGDFSAKTIPVGRRRPGDRPRRAGRAPGRPGPGWRSVTGRQQLEALIAESTACIEAERADAAVWRALAGLLEDTGCVTVRAALEQRGCWLEEYLEGQGITP